MIKILNLYSCIGGNRYKWDDVAKEIGVEIEVTAIELDQELAFLYQERFPNDKVICTDAHQYLLEHYKEFNLIWSSPPCPTHSRLTLSNKNKLKMKYPDLKLYEEILFLKYMFDGKYVVENVIPYYEPLIPAQKRHRHLYWTNINLPNVLSERTFEGFSKTDNEVKKLCEFHDYDFYKYKGTQRRDKVARNLVDYEAGKTIFKSFLGMEIKKEQEQTTLF